VPAAPASTVSPARADRWPLTLLGRVLGPAGVRLLLEGSEVGPGQGRSPTGPAGPAPGPADQPLAGQPDLPVRRLRAVLVDDSPAMRRVLRGLL
jgi:hypothetical protein